MDQGVPIIGDEDTRRLQSDFMFDLYDALKFNHVIYTKEVEVNRKRNKTGELIDIEKIPEKKLPPPKKNLLLIGQEVLETEEQVKKKPKMNQNLILPSQRKRKVDGAKID